MAAESSDEAHERGSRGHECITCKKLGASRKCSECQNVKYCSRECQRADWVRHIIDCNAHNGKPVTSAHHLVYATVAEIPLADARARLDWGLDKAATISSQSLRLLHQLYKGLIVEGGVTAAMLHKWRMDNTLIMNIKVVYEAMPPASRGYRYTWFLEHQSVFTNPYVTPLEDAKLEDSLNLRLWPLIGGDPSASPDAIREFIGKFDEDTRNCWDLFRGFMDNTYPGPRLPLWVEFGFCACPTRQDEMKLSMAYKKLGAVCPLDVFRNAYVAGSLVSLFEKYKIAPLSLPVDTFSTVFHRCVTDALSLPPHQRISVWWLKRLTCIIPENCEVSWQCPYPIDVEWGFVQCKNKKDVQTLMNLYKGFFSSPKSNPLELKAARRAGRLFQYLFGDLKIKAPRDNQKRYKRWFSNLVLSPPATPRKDTDAAWQRLVDLLSPQKLVAIVVMVEVFITPTGSRTLRWGSAHVGNTTRPIPRPPSLPFPFSSPSPTIAEDRINM